MDTIKLKARAKINIGLDVLRRREDGYHEMRMIMQTLRMYDRVDLTKKKEAGIVVETNLSYVPSNENNLAYKAADLLMKEKGVTDGLNISLEKYIPVSAGMAGGSSDAAAVMIGVNKIFNLGFTMEELRDRAVKIGADVPYCIMRGTALAEGIGEKLTPLNPFPKCFVVVAKPNFPVSTKTVFSKLKLDDNTIHPDIDGIITGIDGKDMSKIISCMGNVLESVTVVDYPVIDEIKKDMMKEGAMVSLMSGSGPTVFGLFDSIEAARRAYGVLKAGRKARQIYLTEIFNV